MDWKQRLATAADAALEELDELVDETWRRFERRMGLNELECRCVPDVLEVYAPAAG